MSNLTDFMGDPSNSIKIDDMYVTFAKNNNKNYNGSNYLTSTADVKVNSAVILNGTANSTIYSNNNLRLGVFGTLNIAIDTTNNLNDCTFDLKVTINGISKIFNSITIKNLATMILSSGPCIDYQYAGHKTGSGWSGTKISNMLPIADNTNSFNIYHYYSPNNQTENLQKYIQYSAASKYRLNFINLEYKDIEIIISNITGNNVIVTFESYERI